MCFKNLNNPQYEKAYYVYEKYTDKIKAMNSKKRFGNHKEKY